MSNFLWENWTDGMKIQILTCSSFLTVNRWLIEFYIAVALGIVCKRIMMKSVIKICFWKSKIWMFSEKKTKWKMLLRMHYWLAKIHKLPKAVSWPYFLFVYFFLVPSFSFFCNALITFKEINIWVWHLK